MIEQENTDEKALFDLLFNSFIQTFISPKAIEETMPLQQAEIPFGRKSIRNHYTFDLWYKY